MAATILYGFGLLVAHDFIPGLIKVRFCPPGLTGCAVFLGGDAVVLEFIVCICLIFLIILIIIFLKYLLKN